MKERNKGVMKREGQGARKRNRWSAAGPSCPLYQTRKGRRQQEEQKERNRGQMGMVVEPPLRAFSSIPFLLVHSRLLPLPCSHQPSFRIHVLVVHWQSLSHLLSLPSVHRPSCHSKSPPRSMCCPTLSRIQKSRSKKRTSIRLLQRSPIQIHVRAP
jgi:hypothetical protein